MKTILLILSLLANLWWGVKDDYTNYRAQRICKKAGKPFSGGYSWGQYTVFGVSFLEIPKNIQPSCLFEDKSNED